MPYDIYLDAERIKAICAQEGLALTQCNEALRELVKLAQEDTPHSHYTVAPIRATRGVWHRQKPYPQAMYRTIIEFQHSERQIILHAILKRDDQTYQRVKLLFDRWNPE